MPENKKYYWLKLQDNFFKSKEIKKLRSIAGGDTYTIIYLELQLLSLENGGKLFYEGIEDTFSKELSLVIDEKPEDIEVTLTFLEKWKLLVETDTDEFSLPETLENIGSETSGAARVRRFRERQKTLHGNATVTDCNNLVTDGNTSVTKRNVDIEEDIDIEVDKDIEVEEEKKKGTDTTAATTETLPLEMEDKNFQRIIEAFKVSMYPPGGHELEKIKSWLQDVEPDVVILAINQAVEHNAKTLAYMESIIRNWVAKGLKTKEQVEHYQQEWNERKKPQRYNSYKKPIPGDSHNKRKYDAIELEKQLLARNG